MAKFSFDSQSVAPQTAFSPIPADEYDVLITDSELKDTQSGTGQYIKFTLQVVEGEFANRKLFWNCNVKNDNAKAEQIGQAQLSALCHAAGIVKLSDTTELHDKLVRVKVTIRAADGAYDAQNEVKGVVLKTAATPSAKPATSKAPASAAKPPWAK